MPQLSCSRHSLPTMHCLRQVLRAARISTAGLPGVSPRVAPWDCCWEEAATICTPQRSHLSPCITVFDCRWLPAVAVCCRSYCSGSSPGTSSLERRTPTAGSSPSDAGAAVPHLLQVASAAAGDGAPRPSLLGDAVAAVQHQHWLDQRAPGAREWLQDKALTWWLRGVQARCKQYPALVQQEALVRRLLLQRYREILTHYGGCAVDGRGETHLQVAALLLASHKVLSPWIRDPQELLALLREHNGGKLSPVLRLLLRCTLWLSRDPFAWQLARLRSLALDMGQSFNVSVMQAPDEATLKVRKCFDIFTAEGAPELAACTCCSVDAVWFESLEQHGVHFRQPTCLQDGDSSCSLIVSKLRD